MLILAGIAFVVGAVLGLRYKVPVLAPAAAAILILAVADGVIHLRGIWPTLLSFILSLTCLELGYLFGSAMQSLLPYDRVSEEDRQAAPTEGGRVTFARLRHK